MSEAEAVIPRDATEALELWDKGEPLGAFEVESEGATQLEIYSAAFELMRGGRVAIVDGARTTELQRARGDLRCGLTKRELDVAHSIAHVALLKGWSAMVAGHVAQPVHGHPCRAITITRPPGPETMPVEHS
jgi:hypothetical protein